MFRVFYQSPLFDRGEPERISPRRVSVLGLRSPWVAPLSQCVEHYVAPGIARWWQQPFVDHEPDAAFGIALAAAEPREGAPVGRAQKEDITLCVNGPHTEEKLPIKRHAHQKATCRLLKRADGTS